MKKLERFKAHFIGYENNYVLIGGAACDVLMEEAGLEFRANKDLRVGLTTPETAVVRLRVIFGI